MSHSEVIALVAEHQKLPTLDGEMSIDQLRDLAQIQPRERVVPSPPFLVPGEGPAHFVPPVFVRCALGRFVEGHFVDFDAEGARAEDAYGAGVEAFVDVGDGVAGWVSGGLVSVAVLHVRGNVAGVVFEVCGVGARDVFW